MKAFLVQHGLHKTLQGKSAKPADVKRGLRGDGSKGGKYDPTISRRQGDVQHNG